MDDGLGTAFESLQDQTGKLNIALFYAGGDMEKARQMVAGSFRDMYAVKARFVSSSLNGGFILFYNKIYNKLVSSLAVVIPSYVSKNLETSIDWKIYEKDIMALLTSGEQDEHLGALVKNKIYDSFNFTFAIELSRFLDAKNTIAIERSFQKLIQFILNLQRVDIKIDYQQISSLDMEMFSLSSPKIEPGSLSKFSKPEQGPAQESQASIKPGMEDAKLMLQASLILSPIKGKDISRLQAGDRVRVTLLDKSPKAVAVAQALDAYKDGSFSPVTGRIKQVEHNPDSGYVIYALIAKGIYVRIVEEESTIKVALDPAFDMSRQDMSEENKSNLPVLLLLIAAFVSAVALVVFLVL